MRRISNLVFTASFFALTLSMITSLIAEPQIGKTAPQFSVMDSEGNKQDLKKYLGKTVVLEWTNHECPFVKKHYGSGNMQALQKEATDKDVIWLSVVSSAPGQQGHITGKQASELTSSRKASPSAVILDEDGKIGRAYNATATPNMFVIDKTGKLVYKGAIDDKPSANPADIKIAKNYVRQSLQAIKDGKPIKKAITRPYGCSVKYGS